MSNEKVTGSANIRKNTSTDLQIITLNRGTFREYFMTSTSGSKKSSRSLFQEMAEAVRERKACVISQDVFGVPDKDGSGMRMLKEAMGDINAPVTWLEDGHTADLYGAHLRAVSGPSVERLRLDGRIVGSVFEDNYARYCYLGGLLPGSANLSRSEQARMIFDRMDELLGVAGMDFNHVVRTWFYNNDILDWYGDFNRVRDDFFHNKGIYNGLVPASTGVGGCNSTGRALVSGLLAVKAKNKEVRIFEVRSPLQSAALEYGSSFSRAVELDLPDHRRLYISGTASIDPDGITAHVGDPGAQVRLTMQVVHAILDSRGMDWTDVTRGLAYFKRAEDAPLFEEYLANSKVQPFPVVIAENCICRDDLLFEIEVDAVRIS